MTPLMLPGLLTVGASFHYLTISTVDLRVLNFPRLFFFISASLEDC